MTKKRNVKIVEIKGLNEDIKMKEKQINNINNIIEILQNENDKLKMKLDFMTHNNSSTGEKFKEEPIKEVKEPEKTKKPKLKKMLKKKKRKKQKKKQKKKKRKMK